MAWAEVYLFKTWNKSRKREIKYTRRKEINNQTMIDSNK
jgi:hypothetical protein